MLLLLTAFWMLAGFAVASAAPPERGPELIVKLETPGNFDRSQAGLHRVGLPDVDRALERIGAQAVAPVFPGGNGRNLEIRQRYGLDRYYKIRLRPGADARAATVELRKTRGVDLATEGGGKTLDVESATLATAELIPDDPSLDLQWYLRNTGNDPGGALGIPLEADADIDATDAWALTNGSSSVTVAIIGSGIDFDETQLAGRFWENAAEVAGAPGVDDDGNGYVDDTRGWDWIEGDNDPRNTPNDLLNPNQATLDQTATRAASLIGANGNDAAGIAGVDWNCKFVVIRAYSGSFFASFAEYMESYVYAAELGARVITSNVVFFDLTPEELTIMTDTMAATQAMGAVIAISSGATGTDGVNTLYYPAALPGVLGVASTQGEDLHCDVGRCTFWSTVGPQVSLASPGRRIVQVNPEAGGGPGALAYFNGGNSAAALVAGTAALAFAANPALTADQVSQIVKYTADDQVGAPGEDTPGRDDYTGYGRLNTHRAIQWAVSPPASLSPPGIISLAPGSVTVAENAGSVSLTLSRTGGSGGSVSVSWWTANGTALNGVDYANFFTPEQLVVTWGDGDAADKTISLPIIDNNLYDGDRTFTIGIASPTNGATLDPAAVQSLITIQNEDVDDPPTVSAPASVSGMETVALSFGVTASDPDGDAITSLTTTALPIGASFVADPGNATAQFDWTPGLGQAGTYPITFTATSGSPEATGAASTTVTIETFNQPPVVSAPASVTSPAGITISFPVTATDPEGEVIERLVMSGLVKGMTFTTSGIGTPTATGTFTWTPPVAQNRNVTFAASNGCDPLPCIYEGTAVTAITVTTGGPILSLSLANYNVNEAAGTATITVTRTISSVGALTVDYATSDGTAVNGTDYTGVSGTLTFPDGSTTSRTFTVPILDNAVKEGNRAFNVTLSNPTGGAILNRSTSTVTIQDNESNPGAIRLTAATYSVSETAGSVTISAERIVGSDGTVTVNYATSDGLYLEALNGVHYSDVSGTLAWADGDASPKSFVVPIIDNSATSEGDLRFRVSISTPTGGATLAPPIGADVTILDDGVLAGVLAVSPMTHDFGSVQLGDPAFRAVIVTNTGSATLTVSEPTLTSGAEHGFVLAGAGPLVLAPGESSGFSINFLPVALGPVTGSVLVASDGGSAAIAVTGTGVDLVPPFVSVTSPVAGTSHAAGATVPIEWLASDNHQLQSFDLAYSTDGGATFPNAIASVGAADRAYTWTAPSLPADVSAAIRVTAYDAAGNTSASTTGVFTILSANASPTIDPIADVAVAEGSSVTVPVHASDAEGDAISLTASLPAFGTLDAPTTGNGDVSTTITLSPGFSDAGSYPATVSEAGGASVSFGITVSNTDQGLVLTAPASVSAAERSLFTMDVTASDPDGEPVTSLSADLSALPVGNDAAFAIVGDPLPAAVAQGYLTWTPDCMAAGSYAVIFTATTGTVATATTTIEVADVATAPSISTISTQTVTENEVLGVPVLALHADGDVISLTATLPVFGSLVDNGDGTGTITLAPSYDDDGLSSASVTATGSCGGTHTRSFFIIVNNVDRDPTITAPATFDMAEGTVSIVEVLANDPDGDAMTLTADLSGLPPGNDALFEDIEIAPGEHRGELVWAPGYNHAGSFSVSFTATAAGRTASASTLLQVADTRRAPFVDGGPDRTIDEGTDLTITIQATDPDSPGTYYTITADISQFPPEASFFDAGPGLAYFDWQPSFSDGRALPYIATFSATNEIGLTGTDIVQVLVVDAAVARVFATSKGALRLGSGKPSYCIAIEPMPGSFVLTDIDWSTVRLHSFGAGSVASIGIDATKPVVAGDADNNDIGDATACFGKTDLRNLFSNVSGRQSVYVNITGSLTNGMSFVSALYIEVIGTGGSLAASVSPNPLNPEAVLTFQIRTPGHVRATLHDVQGRLVRRLTDETMSTGWHDLRVDGRDDLGRALRSGVYFYRLETRDGVETGQLTILK